MLAFTAGKLGFKLFYFQPLRSMAVSHQYDSKLLRARCTNVVQLWTRVKSEFEPSSAVNSIQFRSILNCHLTTDQIWILVQLAVTHAHWAVNILRDTIAAKNCPIWILSCPKKLPRIELEDFQYNYTGDLHMLDFYVRFLLYSFYVLFVLDKLTNRWINHIFRFNVLLLH